VAENYGAEVPFLRPVELSTDTSTDKEFMVHAMRWLQTYDACQPELWVHLRPTTPLRDPKYIDEAIALIMSNPTATALRSVHVAPESPYKWFRRNQEGYLTALTTNCTDLDQYNQPRQSYPRVFIPNGYVDIVRSSFVLSNSLLHGDRVLGYESPICTEVDSTDELERLRFQLGNCESPLLDYLRQDSIVLSNIGNTQMANHHFNHTPQIVPMVDTTFRRIVTPLPVPESVSLLKCLYSTESRSMHGQLPVVWDRAEGFQVFDAWGNCWLDFSSTIFVTNAGHGNPRIVKALKRVLEKPLLHTYTYATQERVDFLNYLIQNTPEQFEKAFLLSAGTEATECALKLMRLHGQTAGKRRRGIIAFEGNWHGRTLGAQMMSWNPKQKEWIGYLDPDIHHLPFPFPWHEKAQANPTRFFQDSLNQLLRDKNLDPEQDFCGVILETFQGWGAVFYPPEFVQAVVEFSRQHNMLIAFDEMQSGFGRTGKLFGYMHYGVEPDIICCGKGASSSLPLSIVLGSRAVMDLPDVGSMSSTHSANPMVCAAGRANLEALLEDGLIDHSACLGKLFHKQLKQIQKQFPDYISSVQGKGLLAALLFNNREGLPLSGLCDLIAECCMQRGLLVVHTGRESIKLAPPLCITEPALMEGLEVLNQTIADSILEVEK